MKHAWGVLVAVLSIAAIAIGGSTAFADDGHGKNGRGGRGHGTAATKVFVLNPSTHGNPEGVAADGNSGVFYVGATGDGTIYRGTIDNPVVTEFIPGAPGRSALGLKVADGKLYAAGGTTGKILVFNLATKQLVASFETGAGGFLNDLVVTERGDIYVTDSFRPTLWHVTGAQVSAGSGTPEAIPVGPEVAYVPGGFNLNGIVARKGGRQLIAVNYADGKLYRIDIDPRAPMGRVIRQIDVEPLPTGDGLLLDRGRLIVVQGGPQTVKFIKLDENASRGRVVETRTDPTFRTPSTIARSRNLYLVVNADFTTNTMPFTVSGLPRGGGDDEQDDG